MQVSKANRPFLSVVIPCFNEEKRIKDTIDAIESYLKKQTYPSELIIVDDGSLDGTRDVVQSCTSQQIPKKLITLKTNHGKGFAIKTGVKRAQGNYIVFADADNATPISQLPKLISRLQKGKDIVIGSRYMLSSTVSLRQNLLRRLLSRIGNFFIQKFLYTGIYDTQCGFKGFKNTVAKKIFPQMSLSRFGFDFELLLLAKKHNFDIQEVGIAWNHKAGSTFGFWQKIYVIKEFFSIVIGNMFGRYDQNRKNKQK